jgi:hypothetical protein
VTREVSGTVDRQQAGPWGRVGLWSLVAWAFATAGLAAVDRVAAAGIAFGGGLSLGLFALHRSTLALWRAAPTRRRARVCIWTIWALKWPLVASLLFAAVRSEYASPVWICVGAGLVPGVATLVALWTLLTDRRHGPARLEVG